MSLTVRRALSEDFRTVIRLVRALAEYEQLTPPDEAAELRLKQDGWPLDGAQPRFAVWLSEVKDDAGVIQAVGYAITFETYSSFLAKPTLYIEDIFVLPDHRRAGVGSSLIDRLIVEAQERGCGRIEWVVLDWNTSAQEFYQKYGAKHQTEWQYYRLLID